MDKKTEQLATQAGFVLDELPDTVLLPLEQFATLLREANTREVVALCAKTINNNLNEQKQKTKNLWDIVEIVVIVTAMIAWGTWWYTQLHT
jgi:predicted RecB family endonuclease